MKWRRFIPVLSVVTLCRCGPSYSPDTYASNAVQQANKVEQGVIVGVRDVAVTAAGTVGTVTGAAAGGIAGSQAAPAPLSAFTALGGSLVGGIAGAAAEHTTADTNAFEYIVRKPNGDLVSVTQKDKTPLALGQKVLVIAGNQARVVPDYTVPPSVTAAATPPKPQPAAAPPVAAGTTPVAVEAGPSAPSAAPVPPPATPVPATPAAASNPADSKPADPVPDHP